MKRGWLILLIAIIAIPSAIAAINVNLVTPAGTFTAPNITLNCTGSVTNFTEDGNLGANASLLISTGTPELNMTISTVAGTSYTASFTVYNMPNGNYNWNCRFYNQTADNSVNATGSQGTFSVSTPSPNNAPSFTGTISNQTFAEDGSLSNAFDLDSYFSDASTLTYYVFGNSSLRVTIASDGQVSFSSIGNLSYNETIYFVASDGSLMNKSNNLTINVYPVNDPPYLKSQIPSQNLTKNTNKTITLSDYFADAESDALTYFVSTSPSNINITISGNTATLAPTGNWTGTTTLVFAANDSKNTTNSNTVTLNVVSGANTAPSITEYIPLTDTVVMETDDLRTFTIKKSDSDGDSLTIKWYLNDQEISGAASDSYELANPANGTHTLKVIVSDGNLTAQRSWTVEVSEAIAINTSSSERGFQSFFTKRNLTGAVCGNGVIEEGEDCASCMEDVRCADDEVCLNAKCEKKKRSGRILSIVAIIGAVIGAVFYLLYRKSFSRPKFEDNLMKEKHRRPVLSGDTELKPASEIKDFYYKHESKTSHEQSQGKLTSLQQDVEELRKQGLTDQEITARLRAKGWPQWQIEMRIKGR